MSQELNNSEKNYYFMSCIEMTILDSQGDTGVTRGNSMIISKDGNVPVRLLGMAQNSAFAQLMTRLNDPKLQLLHATFINISPLGHMTQAEMHDMSTLANAVTN